MRGGPRLAEVGLDNCIAGAVVVCDYERGSKAQVSGAAVTAQMKAKCHWDPVSRRGPTAIREHPIARTLHPGCVDQHNATSKRLPRALNPHNLHERPQLPASKWCRAGGDGRREVHSFKFRTEA